MKDLSVNDIIKHFKLKPLWSKDYLVEIYRSHEIIEKCSLGEKYDGDRHLFDLTYYLLPENVICPFHLHLSDESWQYCLGGPLELFIIYPDNGRVEKIVLGNDIFNGQKLIHIVPKNVWMSAKSSRNSKYTLITHFVSPSFMPQDNTKGHYEELAKQFPQHDSLIKEFAWPKEWV